MKKIFETLSQRYLELLICCILNKTINIVPCNKNQHFTVKKYTGYSEVYKKLNESKNYFSKPAGQ